MVEREPSKFDVASSILAVRSRQTVVPSATINTDEAQYMEDEPDRRAGTALNTDGAERRGLRVLHLPPESKQQLKTCLAGLTPLAGRQSAITCRCLPDE